jgi:signal transduction histidine kinase
LPTGWALSHRRQGEDANFTVDKMDPEYPEEKRPLSDGPSNAGDYALSIVETVRQPFLILDDELRVRTANRAFYRTFKVTREETENYFLYDLGNGQWGIPALKKLLEEVLPQNSQVEAFEVENEFPSIGRRTMLLNALRLRNEDRLSRLIFVAIEDVTERRRAEEQLRLFSAKLERSNRELQEFASVASHDLQEPLRKIQAFGDRLKNKCFGSLGEEGRDYLQRMQSAAERMHTLINDLLAFSRVETKAQPFTTVNLARVTEEVLSDLEIQIERSAAVIEVAGLPVIEADPLQMRQLLQNLIGNSLKYHRDGVPPVVKVYGRVLQERRHASGGGAVAADQLCQLFVQDNGIGFDEKYLDRIFTVFQRLHGRQVYSGTGVGLAICRKIVERHGGHITARSAPERGATFVATLPTRQLNGGK